MRLPDAGEAASRLGKAWAAAPFALVFVCYLPVFVIQFAVGEDYRLLAFYDRGGLTPAQMLAEGRPLFALWTDTIYARFRTVESLAAVRFVNVAMIGVIAWLCASAWRRAGFGASDAVIASFLTVTLPSFQLYAACAHMGAVLPGAMAAGLAALVVTRASGQNQQARRWRRRAMALGMLVVALAFYQPAAMFYWVVGAILLLVPDQPCERLKRDVGEILGVGIAGLMAGYVIHRFGVAAFGSALRGPERAMLTSDAVGKITWFVRFPLQDALNFWNLLPSPALACAAGLAIGAGLLMYFRRTADTQSLRLALAGVLVPLAYLPNLVVAENWSSYRSQIALAPLLLTYSVLILRTPFLASRVRLRTATLVTAIAVGFSSAMYNVTYVIALPQVRERNVLREAMATLPEHVSVLEVEPSKWTDAVAPIVRYDEFGRPASSHAWSAAEMTYIVLRDLRRDSGRPVPQVFLQGETDGQAQMRLDLGGLLRSGAKRRP